MRPVLLMAGLLALGAGTPTNYYNSGSGSLTTGTNDVSGSSDPLTLFSGSSSTSGTGCDSATGAGCRGNSGSTNGFSSCDPSTGIGCRGNGGSTNEFSSGGCNPFTGVGCGGNRGTSNNCNPATGIGCSATSSNCNPATGFGCGDSANVVGIGNSNIGSSGSGRLTSGGAGINCPQDRVVTVPRVSTSVRRITNTVAVPQQRTQFVTQTSLVPSFTTSIAVRTDIDTRTQFRTRTETNVNTQQVVSTVRLPDQTNTRIETVRRTQVDTQFVTQTQYVTRQDVRTSVSVINTERQVETVVRVPQLQVSTQVVQVPGPARTQVETVFRTSQVISYYRLPVRTIVQTSTSYRTEVITQQVRQPDTIITVTSVNFVPVTSVIINTRVVPQYVTVTQTVARTITRTQATTQFVPVRSTIVQNVFKTRFQTDFVTQTEQVVRTQVRQEVETVRVPSQPRVVFRTEQVQERSTVRGADTFSTQIVTVPRQREVVRTQVVDRVQNQERVVKVTQSGGYCGGSHSKGYGGYHKY